MREIPELTHVREPEPESARLSKARVALLIGVAMAAVMALGVVVTRLPWPSLSIGGKPAPLPPAQGTDPREAERYRVNYVPQVREAMPSPVTNGAPPAADDAEAKALRRQVADLERQLKALAEVKHAVMAQAAPAVDPRAEAEAQRQREWAAKRREAAKKRREAFATSETVLYMRKPDDQDGLGRAGSPYALTPGHYLPCLVEPGVTSDAPGRFKLRIRETVYDSATGRYPLIPQAAVVTGTQQGHVLFGKSRIEPKLESLTIDGQVYKADDLEGADRVGQAGWTDRIDRHYARLLSAVILSGVLRSGTTAAVGSGGDPMTRIAGSVASETAQQGTQQVRQALVTSPTLDLRPGMLCNLVVTKTVIFPGPYVERH